MCVCVCVYVCVCVCVCVCVYVCGHCRSHIHIEICHAADQWTSAQRVQAGSPKGITLAPALATLTATALWCWCCTLEDSQENHLLHRGRRPWLVRSSSPLRSPAL